MSSTKPSLVPDKSTGKHLRPNWLRSKMARWALLLYRLGIGTLISRKVMLLTTVGRVSGRSRTMPTWYIIEDDTLFCFSGWGASSDWIKNLKANPQVGVTIGRHRFNAEGSLVGSPTEQARVLGLFQDKYGRRTVRLFYHLDLLVLVAFPLGKLMTDEGDD